MLDIENIVYSRVIGAMPERIKEKYPNLNFTTSDSQVVTPKFPSVYIHQMSSPEMGQTIDGFEINAIMATFQIEVTDNVSQSNCTQVMNEVVTAMKSMRFNVTMMPEFNNSGQIYRKIARFRRLIGALDTL